MTYRHLLAASALYLVACDSPSPSFRLPDGGTVDGPCTPLTSAVYNTTPDTLFVTSDMAVTLADGTRVETPLLRAKEMPSRSELHFMTPPCVPEGSTIGMTVSHDGGLSTAGADGGASFVVGKAHVDCEAVLEADPAQVRATCAEVNP